MIDDAETDAICFVPEALTGQIAISVSSNGIECSDSQVFYTAIALDSLSYLDPCEGAAGGGTVVNVKGRQFAGTAFECVFGDYSVQAALTQTKFLRCLSPPGHAGKRVHVSVLQDGVPMVLNELTYEYQFDPDVTAIHPSSGPTKGFCADVHKRF